jgi:hypothetical protein
VIGYRFFTYQETSEAAIGQLAARWPDLRFALQHRSPDWARRDGCHRGSASPDNLDTRLARVQVIDMTFPVTFQAGLLGAGPRKARLPQRHGGWRCDAGHRPGIADYTGSTPPDWAGATRSHIGKNSLRLGRGRPLIAIDGRMVVWSFIGTLNLHVAQYAPSEQVARKPRTPRRSLITVSNIVGPPHRLHSIAMSRLRLSFSTCRH